MLFKWASGLRIGHTRFEMRSGARRLCTVAAIECEGAALCSGYSPVQQHRRWNWRVVLWLIRPP